MAVLLAIDGGVDLDDAVPLPLGKADELHRSAVGDLLVQTQEELFPDDLGTDLTLRLVGHHVLGEQAGALGRKRASTSSTSSTPSPFLAEMGRMAWKVWASA